MITPTFHGGHEVTAPVQIEEAGSVLFPSKAPWLSDFISELLAFPSGRHDDQVDSLSQALTWNVERRQRCNVVLCGPIVVRTPLVFGYET
jgi:phage terminase large subunit-like protein